MKKAIIAAVAILGSSTAAMADSNFSFRARASYQTPVRATYRSRDAYQISQPTYRPIVEQRQPILPTPTEDCANWDPTVTSQPGCDQLRVVEEPHFAGWQDLGVRDSHIGDHQYITEQTQLRTLRVVAVTGAPQIQKIGVSFTDGRPSQQLPVQWDCEKGLIVQLPDPNINQIVVATAPGSRGTYAVYAR